MAKVMQNLWGWGQTGCTMGDLEMAYNVKGE